MVQSSTIPRPALQNEDWLPCLDGVRGYAALWVFAGHTAEMAGNWFPILTWPQLAVDIFMIVSGLLMTHHYYMRQAAEPWERPATWRTFYLRRFFRLAPLYYLLLIPAFLLAGHYLAWAREVWGAVYPDTHRAALEAGMAYDWQRAPTFDNIAMHYSFLFGFCPRYAASTALPDWSIGLEMQFYLAFPFLMLALRRWGALVLGLAVLGVQAFFLSKFAVYASSPPKPWGLFLSPSLLPLKLSFFYGGILLGMAYHHRTQVRSCALYLVLGLAFCGYAGHWPVVLTAVAMALMLFRENADGRGWDHRLVRGVHAFFSNAVARFLADTSYCVYLLHGLIVCPIALGLIRVPAYLRLPSSLRLAVLFGLSLPVVLGLSWLAHRWVEKPGIGLGKKVLRGKATRKTPQAELVPR